MKRAISMILAMGILLGMLPIPMAASASDTGTESLSEVTVLQEQSLQAADETADSVQFEANLSVDPVFANNIIASGTCGENLTWTLSDDGMLTVSGEGDMLSAPWADYADQIVAVTLEDGIISIADSAFYECRNLTAISIPDSVTSIGESALGYCVSLTAISIPDSVTSIGEKAFCYCKSLTTVTIPESVTSIRNHMFIGCDGLTTITIPDSVTSIGEAAFRYCRALTTVTIPESVTSIGNDAFFFCDSLTSISIPDSVTSIGEGAFYRCTKLSKIYFEGNAPEFGEDSFEEVTATAYYPANNSTWTSAVKQNYGGNLTWVSYEKHEHHYTGVITKPTCTEQGFTTYTCECGDSYVKNFVEPTGHTIVTISGKAATCTESGLSDSQKCSVCNVVIVEQQVIAPTEHREVVVKGRPATCTETGLSDGVKCADCGLVIESQETIPTKDHTRETIAGKPATCTETGLTDGEKCSVCSTVLVTQETIPARGHSWDDGVITKKPTETETGIRTYNCENCDATRTEVIPVLDHKHSYTAVVTKPTCTQKGYTTYTCSCGDSYTDKEVAALGHTRETIAGKPATCTETGLTDGEKCSVCNTVLVNQETIPARGHSWDDGVITKKPTETETGIRVYNCKNCDATRTEDIPVLDHKHSYTAVVTKPTCTQKGYTTYTCSCGDSYTDKEVAPLGHTRVTTAGKPATCTETGLTDGEKCSVCNTVLVNQETIPARGHSWDDGVITKKPTETETGIRVYNCKNCDATRTEDIPVLDHKHSYTAVVTKPTCTEKGYTTYTCSCGDSYTDKEVAALGHKWDSGVVTKEPTASAPGVRKFTCTVCKATKTEEIAYCNVYRVSGKDRVKTALSVANALLTYRQIEKFDAVIIATGVNEKFADALSGSYLANMKKAPILLYTNSGLSQLNVKFIKERLKAGGTVYILGGTSAIPESVEKTLSAYKVKRLSGKSRYETNLAILKEAGVSGAKEILVATGTNFADSLSASAVGLPLMLVNGKGTGLNGAQINFLKSVAGRKITIIGGTGAVNEEMEVAIEAAAGVNAERISGKTRHDTSVLIAQKYFNNPGYALITYAKNFPDGLAGGPLAYAMGAPLLLTSAGQESITNKYLTSEGIDKGFVLGGDSAVSDETARKAFGLANGAVIEKAFYTE